LKNHDYLIPIFHKYLNNQCSPAEVAELLAYFRMEGDHGLLRPLILQQLEKNTTDITEETVDEAAFDRIFLAVSKQIDSQEQHVPIIRRRLHYWVGIAASLFMVFAIGLYLHHNNQQPGNSISQNKPNHTDIAPGGNKAKLTLSNGSIITLDGAKNGQIARQKTGIVNKDKDGEVVYQSNDNQAVANVTELNTITTPRGGQYTVVLPDGSKVWLNAASSLKFPVAFTGPERNVELTGEAYFEVAKNKQKPFKVSVNGATVEVLGTHFNIMAYSDEAKLRTTLLEGSVKISKGDKDGLLKPGMQADIDKQNNIKITEADTEQAMAWKNGYFKFSRDNIQTIMRQLSRWYDIDVVYDGSIPNDEFVGKIRRNANVSEVLRVLELNNVHFKIVNKKIIVTNI
jgi:transmembrane sensor